MGTDHRTDPRTDPTIDPITGTAYTLRLIAEAGDLKHYRMEVPGQGRMQSTDLVFTVDHIAIFGDLCPGRNGVVSCLGYGLAWFSGRKSRSYLAEKFLDTGWHQDLAHAELLELILTEPKWLTADGEEGVDDIVWHLHGLIDDGDPRGLGDWLTERGVESEDVPGYGYAPQDVELLSLLNRRFSALYLKEVARG